jgi:hypothetical protein
LELFPTLGQTCDDLAVYARPLPIANPTERGSLARLLDASYPALEAERDCSRVWYQSYKRRRFAASAGPGESLSAMMMQTDFAARSSAMRAMTLKLGNGTARQGIDEMPVHKMRFVLVNNMAPRKPSVCAACSRPLNWGYLHDLSTSNRYCGIKCYPQRMVFGGFDGLIALTNPFELAIVWPKLTVDVASVLLDSAWSDHGG